MYAYSLITLCHLHALKSLINGSSQRFPISNPANSDCHRRGSQLIHVSHQSWRSRSTRQCVRLLYRDPDRISDYLTKTGGAARSCIPHVPTNESNPSHTPSKYLPIPIVLRVLRIKAIATVRTISIEQKVGASNRLVEVNRLIIQIFCQRLLKREKVDIFWRISGVIKVKKVIRVKKGSWRKNLKTD